MSISAEVLDAMLAAGCTAEQIVAAVKADLAAQESLIDEQRKDDPRQAIPQKEWYALRQAVFERDGHLCTYCGQESEFPLECDHIVPLCQGGGFDIENLTTACKRCNSSKRHRTPEEWRGAK